MKPEEQAVALVELEAARAVLRRRQDEALKALTEAVAETDRRASERELERALMLGELRQLADKLTGERHEHQRTYVVSTLFLRDCHRILVAGEDEHLHYVTGIELGRLLTLDRIIEIDLDEASRVSATGNLASSHAALRQLEASGHKLHGLFHRHPGQGMGATRPSSVDLGTQEQLERARYPCVGAIFTQDGYLRFFSVRNRFEVFTYGEGVDQIEDETYRLAEIS